MSGRRAPTILAILAGAAILATVAAVFLGGDPPAPAPLPDPPRTAPVPAAVPPRIGRTEVPPPRVPVIPPVEEDDAPPVSERTSIPAGWKPWARLRFVDAATKAEIPFGKGHVALLVFPGPQVEETPRAPILFPEPWRRAPDGRIEVFRSEDERGLPGGTKREEWDAFDVEVRIPGWDRRRFPSRAELSGDRDVELTPSVPSVRGTVRLAPGVAKKRLHMVLEPADPTRDPRRLDAMPSGGSREAGPFAWYDVPDGSWRLVVRATGGEGTGAHAVRAFEKAGSAVDLGEIPIFPPTTLRVRVVARDGTGVLDRDLAVRLAATGESVAAGEIDDGGWVVFEGLEADAELRIVSSLDKLEATARTPSEGGGDLRVEIPWDHQGVRCRLRFTVDGQDPIQWGDLVEGPTLDKGAWKKDGYLEHDMAPGDYLVGFLARPVGKAEPVRVYARFTVPDRPLFDATVDLTESK